MFLIGSGFAFLGALVTWVLVEDTGRDLNNEDELWKEYLAKNGWKASFGDIETKDHPKALMQPTGQTS